MPNIERFSNPHRCFLLKPPVMCCEGVYNRASNSLFVLLSPLLPSFSFSFSPWPWILFLSLGTARIPAAKSQRETLFPAEGRKCCRSSLIDKRCRALLSSCNKQIPASVEVGVFKLLISTWEFALHRVRKDDLAYWCGPWSSSGHSHCRVIMQIWKGTTKYEMMALGHDSCW